jgi:beta-glucanase (GH16 family)
LLTGSLGFFAGCDSAEPSEDPSGGLAGMAGSTSAGSTGVAPTGEFTLLFRDDFDAFDQTRWQFMTHSWATNLALFSAEPASFADGKLSLGLLPAPAGTTDDQGAEKQFLGVEMRSRDTLTYGRVRARAKFARGSAVVSSLVTIYTPWPADNWNELDIESLGASPSSLQFNAQVYTGPPTTPPVAQSVSPTQDPYQEELGFDASADFHVYEIEWTPEGAKFLIDEELRYTWTRNIALMNLPQNVLLTIWASSSAAWAGPVTDETSAAVATYDFIELYRYAAP